MYQFLINSTALSNFHCFCFFCFTLFFSVLGFTLLTPSPPNSFAHFEAPPFLLSQSQPPRSQSLGLLLSCLLTRHPKFFLHCNHCNYSLPTPLPSPSLFLPLNPSSPFIVNWVQKFSCREQGHGPTPHSRFPTFQRDCLHLISVPL